MFQFYLFIYFHHISLEATTDQTLLRGNRPICYYTKEEPLIGFLDIFEFSSPQHVKLYAKTETKGHRLQVVCGGAQVPASNRRTNSRL
jgi:hypothetical protein